MRTTTKTFLVAGVLALSGVAGSGAAPARAQGPDAGPAPARAVAPGPAPAARARSAYWGNPAPARRRFISFKRLRGLFGGPASGDAAHADSTDTALTADRTTGRTNTGLSKPWMSQTTR